VLESRGRGVLDARLRGHDSGMCVYVLATQIVRVLQNGSLQNQRARGRPGPAGPMVRVQQKARGRTTGSAGNARPSPRDGLTAYTRSPRGPAFLPPSSATLTEEHHELDLSTGRPGPRDFTGITLLFVRMRSSRCNTDMPTASPPRVS
jgi:hypothetical protein